MYVSYRGGGPVNDGQSYEQGQSQDGDRPPTKRSDDVGKGESGQGDGDNAGVFEWR